MSSNLQALDDFPSFTGEESPQEQIRQLQNYLFVVAEQLKYTMRNIGVDNLNPKQWDAMKEETLKGLIANYIIAGILKSKDGKTFYLDLDKGVLKMEATEFSVKGKTVAEAAVDGMSQMDVFNKLFNNGKVKGFEIVNDKLIISGDLAVIKNILANNITSGKLYSKDKHTYVDLDNGRIVCEATDGYKVLIGDGQIRLIDENEKSRISMARGADDTYMLLMHDGDGEVAGGFHVFRGKIYFGCPNTDDGNVTFNAIERKRINGVDYYVSP